MKLQTIALASLLALSTSASAGWFNGFNNGAGNTNGYGNASGNTNGAGNGSADAQANGNGWGTGKGDADGEVGFSITFKSKGKTDMDTAGNLSGDTRGYGNNNGYGSNVPAWSNNVAYAPAAAAQAQPDYEQLKAMWEAQRKQADEMLKRIETAQKTAPKS